MPLDEEAIREFTRVVWTTVLGLEAEAASPYAPVGDELTTSVDVSGAWEGTISLRFSPGLETRLAAAMLACSESETTPALVRDVAGELANVLGGNVKGALPGPSKLSQPRVAVAVPRDALEPDDSRRVWFGCSGQTFSVTVTARPARVEVRT